ncbi:MAG: hypothetical protein FGM48_06475 [Candidatus Nanopelagicaceae bacterium]|nr:hypothetical protein [Candidatus Nanopelagicaceae bacterium]
MKLSRILEPKNYLPSHGEKILKPYPHNKKAVDLFSKLSFDNKEQFEHLVKQLLIEKSAKVNVNNISITFTTANRCLSITYTFANELSVSDMVIYDSLFKDNNPQSELFFEITKAVCNAQLAKKPNQIIIYNYPATAMYLNPVDRLPIKEKVRALLKHPLFLRFR